MPNNDLIKRSSLRKLRSQLENRVVAAQRLERRLDTITDKLNSIPSFQGKALFMDQVIAAYRCAAVIAWDLKYVDLADFRTLAGLKPVASAGERPEEVCEDEGEE